MAMRDVDPAGIVDGLLEASVVGSFTSLGIDLRSRLGHWDRIDDHAMRGRTVAITGATSGLGAAAARRLASLGATIVLIARNPEKATRTAAELEVLGAGHVSVVIADMAELEDIREAAGRITEQFDTLDVLIHNAGALSATHRTNSTGTEMTVASQVHGPFLLTSLLLALLRNADPGRVLTMSSGGMYTQRLDVDHLEMPPENYRGSVAYARAKRAQVTLNELWAQHVPGNEIVFHALHPGWADTPGVAESLPRFRRILGPALRTPEQGADTLVWLAVERSVVPTSTGRFWHDRRVRHTHLPGPLGDSESDDERSRLWQECEQATGIQPDPQS